MTHLQLKSNSNFFAGYSNKQLLEIKEKLFLALKDDKKHRDFIRNMLEQEGKPTHNEKIDEAIRSRLIPFYMENGKAEAIIKAYNKSRREEGKSEYKPASTPST